MSVRRRLKLQEIKFPFIIEEQTLAELTVVGPASIAAA